MPFLGQPTCHHYFRLDRMDVAIGVNACSERYQAFVPAVGVYWSNV